MTAPITANRRQVVQTLGKMLAVQQPPSTSAQNLAQVALCAAGVSGSKFSAATSATKRNEVRDNDHTPRRMFLFMWI
jgi:hypothetical protein